MVHVQIIEIRSTRMGTWFIGNCEIGSVKHKDRNSA